MNINSAIPMQPPLKPQVPVQTAVPTPKEVQPSDTLTHQEKKEAFAKEFYTRKEEPWKGEFYHYGDNIIKDEMREMTKEIYLDFLKMKISIELDNQYAFFTQFREQISHMRPDLTENSFSFTLGDDAELKILDPGGTLNDDDLQWLTKTINTDSHFKESTRKAAKMIMTLVDHDPKNFPEKQKLSLLNFQDIIDIGNLHSDPNKDVNEAWTKQLKKHDDKNESSLIDIYA